MRIRVGALALALVIPIGLAGAAQADTVTTTTGQKLTVDVGGGLVDDRATAKGTASITAGSATITSVVVRFDGHKDIKVELDPQGRFAVDAPWAPDANRLDIVATATASDGTESSSRVGVTIDRATAPEEHVSTLPNTGPSGPRALGPLGLALVAVGSVIAWRNRRRATV